MKMMIKRFNLAEILAQVLLVLCLLAFAGLQGVSAQSLPSCTTSLNIPDDNDGVPDPMDIDKDNNGLIEICDLEGLDAMRDNLSGSGTTQQGCPSDGCNGYELTRSLDFIDDNSYRTTANKVTWTTGDGWQPIGIPFDLSDAFIAKFNGNNHTISNLMINRRSAEGVGLFGYSGTGGEIANLGLLDVNIKGGDRVGGLVGANLNATITNSYATGTVSGSDRVGGLVGTNLRATIKDNYATATVSGPDRVGGLVGNNLGTSAEITNSYATGTVSGSDRVGGLVGLNELSATIRNSYATGTVSGSDRVGGLVGNNSATISNSYWLSSSADSGGTGIIDADTEKTAMELTSPTAAEGIYGNWSPNDWDFGSSNQFPILKSPDNDTLLPGQGVGLRSLQSSTTGAELRPTFSDAITFYAITPPSTSSIALTLTAYHPAATIALVQEGEATDYFANKGSRGSASVPITTNPVLIITVSEPNLDPISYRVVLTNLSPCAASLNTPDDNDSVERAMDVDKDGDGLIEICDLEGLNEMRHQLDGTGYKANVDATGITTGCPSTGCRGYELTKSLDFMDDDSYRTATNRATWTTGQGWEPIGTFSMSFNTILEGNGHTISNLMINRTDTSSFVGLFGSTGQGTKITNLGVINVDITSGSVGGLAGFNGGGTIMNSYVTGKISGSGSDGGGLVGNNVGSITNSYAMASVLGSGNNRGGLVGNNAGFITNSYATGTVEGSGDNRGGLVGNNGGTITNSYVTSTVSGSGDNVGGLVGSNSSKMISHSYWQEGSASSGGTDVAANTRKTIQELTSPTTATGIYSNWGTDDWDFGNSNQYPALKYAKGTDTNDAACSDTPPQTGTDQPQCETLLPHQGMNIGDSDLREGLRKLDIIGAAMTEFDSPLGVSTNNYVVTIFLPTRITEYPIVLRLEAYNPDAEIQIFKAGDSTNYFEGKMSGDESLPIDVASGTQLTIRVSEPNIDYTLTFATALGELPSIRVRVKVFLEGSLQ